MKLYYKLKINTIFLLPVYMLLFILIICLGFSVFSIKTEHDYNKNNHKYMIKVKLADDNIKEFELEEYLLGVVCAEMPPAFEEEALKAQAIAARTYIINRRKNPSNDHAGADVCADPSHCKAYISETDAIDKWKESWQNEYKSKIFNSVKSTEGIIITYDNEPITAVFHSTSSGKTENSGDVWQNQLPYLKSIVSEGEELSPRFKSVVEISKENFQKGIKEINNSVDFSHDISVSDYIYTEGGSVKTVKICGIDIKGTEIRNKFSLRSANFKISVKDSVVFEVIGNGHGVGMSQYGANYAAASGQNYEQILKKYYQGVELEKIY